MGRQECIVICLILAVLPTISHAQKNTYVFHQLTSADGLSSARYNYYIHQDPYGLVWISSIAGLNRFDGRRVKKYLPKRDNPQALHTVYASMSSFHDTADGNMWFTEDEALICYDRKNDHFERFQAIDLQGDTIKGSYSWCYLDSLQKNIWFHANKQLFSYNLADQKTNWVDSLYIYIEARMFEATNGDYVLASFKEKSIIIKRYGSNYEHLSEASYPTPSTATIHELEPVNDSLIWVGTTLGLYAFNPENGSWTAAPNQWQGETVDNIKEIVYRHANCLIIGTKNKGIFFYDPVQGVYTGKVIRFFHERLLPFHPKLVRLTLDYEDNLWVSTDTEGIFYTNLSKPKFDRYLTDADKTTAVYALEKDSKGQILAVTTEGIYSLEDSLTKKYQVPQQSATNSRPRFLYLDQQQQLWLGTESGLYLKKEQQYRFHLFTNVPTEQTSSTAYTSMTELANGDYLFGTNRYSPFRLSSDLSRFEFIDTLQRETVFVQLISDYVFTYSHDSQLRIYEQKQGELLLDTTLAHLAIVNAISHDNRQLYWLGTDEGLYRLQQQQNGWILEKDSCITSGAINAIQQDDYGQLWLGTPQGLTCYQPLQADIHAFTIIDGLQSNHFNPNATVVGSDGLFYFAGTNGVNVFHPADIQSNISKAEAVIVNILVNQNENIPYFYSNSGYKNPAFIEQLTLPFDKNNVEVWLSAGEYSDPLRCQFKYQLMGSTDEQLINLNNDHLIRFNNLSEGSYQLKIWATNADGIESDTYRELAIIILPPWYRTFWFFATITALISLGIYAFYRYRLVMITRQKNAQLQVAETQTQNALLEAQNARTEQDKANSEIAVLRLQMNPHFIFNSLNSIDAYILKEHPLEAHDFLIRFADLMRKILDQSEDQLSRLVDEVHFLKEYLAIEQERFGQRLKFNLYVDSRLNIYTVKLPTMVLQPFIENAIIHGIASRPEGGLIQINFLAPTDHQLLIEVKDNGVGRKQQDSQQPHESKATKITQRRLVVLAKSLQLPTIPHFEIIDEKDANGDSAGTTVRFYFSKL